MKPTMIEEIAEITCGNCLRPRYMCRLCQIRIKSGKGELTEWSEPKQLCNKCRESLKGMFRYADKPPVKKREKRFTLSHIRALIEKKREEILPKASYMDVYIRTKAQGAIDILDSLLEEMK